MPPSRIFRNGIDCSGGFDTLGEKRTADAIAGTAPPLVIEAEKEFAVYADLRKKSPLRYCDLMISFFPEPGGRCWMRLERGEQLIATNTLVDQEVTLMGTRATSAE